MRLKKLLIFAIVFMLMMTACAKSDTVETPKETEKIEETAQEKIQKTLSEMTSYVTSAVVTYISNKGSNVYETLQHVRMSGEYRIEVTGPENAQGNVTFSDGNTITQYNKKIEGRISVGISENMERSELLLSSFMKNYANSLEVSVSVANLDDGECTVLEATVPNNHPYIRTQKLWISNETLKPVRMVIYDGAGSERIIIDYTDFEYNVDIPDSLFTMN